MLEAIRFKLFNRKKSFGIPPLYKIVLGALAVVGAVVLIHKLDPAEAYHRFMHAAGRIAGDFSFTVSRSVDDCGMLLWTNNNTQKASRMEGKVTLEQLSSTQFDVSLPLVLLYHGFSDSPDTTWIRSVKGSFLKNGRYNVFSVDWRPLARSPWYSTAANNAETAGEYGAQFLEFMTSPEVGFPPAKVHIIGASLGAHASAIAGNKFKLLTGNKVGRITGLDPSGPLHYSVSKDLKLDKDDADFVDVIHTAGKWVGTHEDMGHVDFFPNLGEAPQPGCQGRESIDLSCSHFTSWKVFSKSIRGEKFYSLRCPSKEDYLSKKCCSNLQGDSNENTISEIALMGLNVDQNARGRYYLKTDGPQPMGTKEKSVGCTWIPD